MNPTIKDVAELVGVHPSTVSRVINDDSRISEKTREKVFLIIKKLGYTPNAIARGLKTKRTHTLGMLIPDITNPFFAEIARGVEDAANKNDFNIILCNTDDRLKKERTYLEILRGKRVDGLILGTAHIKDKSILELEKNNFPYILVSRNIEGLDKNCVIVDDEAGGIMAAEYLIKLGHRRIAHITGPLKTRSALNRLKGYKLTLKKHEIEYEDELVGEGDFRIKGGYQVMKRFLKLAEPPTAIFAANDLLALGAMQAIQKKNFHIPEDFSVIGFNDIELASFVYPALTTIRQPMLEMGALAVKMLLRIIEEGEFNQRKIVLKPKLIIRESCKKINKI
ncbi:LacI family transcriptional regulator [Candidatus Atribacteria bacterium HGW-Atribacteria-1]|nr:MAG: LacI family transcriptional regulator [Candidatus Atribacteria bacterium HGW-Atribacteria-1]